MKKEYYHNGLKMDSQEEIDFQNWIEEALQAGFLKTVTYHPEPYLITPKQTFVEKKVLKTKIKIVERTLLQPHKYQPDFIIEVTNKFLETFPNTGLLPIKTDPNTFVVDVKGTYNQNDALRRFSIDQKLVYHLHEIFVNKVVPADFFLVTWVPLSCAYMSNRRELTRRKPFAGCKLLVEL